MRWVSGQSNVINYILLASAYSQTAEPPWSSHPSFHSPESQNSPQKSQLPSYYSSQSPPHSDGGSSNSGESKGISSISTLSVFCFTFSVPASPLMIPPRLPVSEHFFF
jgi:hypothetical protein